MKRKIAFVLFPKTHLMDLAGPAQVFYEAGQLGRRQFDLIFSAADESVRTEQGLLLGSLQPLDNLNLKAGDLICIPGIDFKGFQKGALDEAVAKTKSWLWEQKRTGVFISSICSGALILAKMGLLDHVECTTHWKCIPFVKTHFPKARLRKNRLYCFDRGIFTSAGMTSGIDMALALVERWSSPLLAAKVAQEMVINVRRPETKEQKNTFLDFKNHFNPDVYKAQEILANRLEARYTIDELAREMNMSSRHLTRLFKRHTGRTIHQYRNHLRLEHGEKLLMHSERSIKEIAQECGFENARQFIRVWKTEKGCPPGEFRKINR